MDLDSVVGVTPKGFDCQVSLNPFEERLNLPPVAVDVGNDKRPRFKVVGYEGDNLFFLIIIELFHAQVFRVILLDDVADYVNSPVSNDTHKVIDVIVGVHNLVYHRSLGLRIEVSLTHEVLISYRIMMRVYCIASIFNYE